jgi:hypothetical protein
MYIERLSSGKYKITMYSGAATAQHQKIISFTPSSPIRSVLSASMSSVNLLSWLLLRPSYLKSVPRADEGQGFARRQARWCFIGSCSGGNNLSSKWTFARFQARPAATTRCGGEWARNSRCHAAQLPGSSPRAEVWLRRRCPC